jgi:hypothetical protein
MTAASPPPESRRPGVARKRRIFPFAWTLQAFSAVLFSFCRWATGGFQ